MKRSKDTYKLSINLPASLMSKVHAESDRQCRTAASLIRQVLTEKFMAKG